MAAFDSMFAGQVSGWVYEWLRITLAAVLLIRHSDILRPLVALEHHRFVRGLDFTWSIEQPPYLVSPLIPGLVLGEVATNVLVVARTGLAICLLLGVWARPSAAMLAAVSYVVFASDRYHYSHHLHLLYVSIGWLALAPIGRRYALGPFLRSVHRTTRASPHAAETPLWPLQMLRALVVSLYLASGVSKLNADWWSGSVLADLHRLRVVGGASWDALADSLGYAGVARLTCIVELGLPVLLAWHPTRRSAVLLGWAFHALISASMDAFTFGAQMAILLCVFLPKAWK